MIRKAKMERRYSWSAGVFLCALAAHPGVAADLEAVGVNLAETIQQSQRELSRVETDIAGRRQAMARELNEARNRVEGLRKEAVAVRRLYDEQTLTLEQLENRLQAWSDQSAFQSRVLDGFAGLTQAVAVPAGVTPPATGTAESAQAGSGAAESTQAASGGEESAQAEPGTTESAQAGSGTTESAPVGAEPAEQSNVAARLRQLAQYVADQENRLYPQWQAETLALPDGRITQADLLRLGPVAWFWRPEAGQGGLVNSDFVLPQAALTFTGGDAGELARLYQTGQGSLSFDPTLSRALVLAGTQETLLEHLQKGGLWVIPILGFALFAAVIALFKFLSLWRLPPLLAAMPARVEKALSETGAGLERLRGELRGAQAELLDISLQARTGEQRDDRLFACLLKHQHHLERWLGAIAVTASVSPLLGLLGTVSGMITTFQLMTLFGAGDPSSVSSGISEALVTTELGLIVAIPALVAHALMSKKIKSYYSQLETEAIQLSQLDYPEPGR